MPSLNEVLEFRRKMFEESMAIIEKKGHDYNRKQQHAGDTLFNLKVASILGIVETPEQGILVRLSDKFMRLISLMAPGVEAAVQNESVRDSVRDFHNYLDYALQFFEARQQPDSNFAPDETAQALSKGVQGRGVPDLVPLWEKERDQ